jgi:hypothetical protein
MGPPGKKKPLRTADGRPEMRSPDQILKDAASDINKDLPNKGRKLDLDAYFRGGAADRVANRLLKDNGVRSTCTTGKRLRPCVKRRNGSLARMPNGFLHYRRKSQPTCPSLPAFWGQVISAS